MKTFNYILVLIVMAVGVNAFAGQQIWVRSNADLPERVAPVQPVVNATIKAALNAGAPVHEDGYKYLTVYDAKVILKSNRGHARAVIKSLAEDGIIMTYGERYSILYPSNALIP